MQYQYLVLPIRYMRYFLGRSNFFDRVSDMKSTRSGRSQENLHAFVHSLAYTEKGALRNGFENNSM